MRLSREDRKLKNLERRLRERIKNFILGKKVDAESLKFELELFFNSKTEKQINLIEVRNLRLFLVALEVLNNFKNTEIERANLDYIYGYKNPKPLRYCWKTAVLNIIKYENKIRDAINNILKEGEFSKKSEREMKRFI